MVKLLSQNKFVLHPHFTDRILALKDKVDFSSLIESKYNLNGDFLSLLQSKPKFSTLGDVTAIKLDAQSGFNFLNQIRCAAYDESIDQFQALEGTAYVTCHSLITIDEEDYLASNCLSFAFYTRSKVLLENNPAIKKVNENPSSCMPNEDPLDASYKDDYYRERKIFILNNCPDNALLFIDGPLITGLKTVFNLQLNTLLLQRKTIPVFIVKNSSSNLVVDNIKELSGQFNSDLHWVSKYLKEGERTSFFKYTDDNNENISKVFCYIKPFENQSPQRVEFHEDTFFEYEPLIPEIMNLIYYFYLDQGPETNIQIRPIIIAEKFARETKKMINIRKIIRSSNIQATMNQTREMTL